MHSVNQPRFEALRALGRTTAAPLTLRCAIIFIGFLDSAVWAGAAILLFGSPSDPATRAFDIAAGVAVTALFVLTAVPALVLAMFRRVPRTSLALALAFPAGCLMLFVAAALAFG
jgi:hypothetical protein